MSIQGHDRLVPMDVLDLVLRERERQLEKWGDQSHPDGTGRGVEWFAAPVPVQHVSNAWMREYAIGRNKATPEDGDNWFAILAEELFEAGCETSPRQLEHELVQVMAVCAAWIRDIRRR